MPCATRQRKFKNITVTMTEWPENNSDQNPIEKLWDYIGIKLWKNSQPRFLGTL